MLLLKLVLFLFHAVFLPYLVEQLLPLCCVGVSPVFIWVVSIFWVFVLIFLIFFCPSFPIIFLIIVLFFIVLHLSKQRSVSSVDNTNGFWCGAWLCCAPAHGATIVSSIICCGRGWWVLLYSPDASVLWSYIGWVTPFYI